MSRWERAHRRNMVRIQKLIDKIYQTAIREAGHVGEIAKRNFAASRAFSLDEWPVTQRRVQSLLESLQNNLNVAIVDGVQSAWTLSNNKNNELCNAVFGSRVAQLSLEQYQRYYSNNYAARDAFIARRDAGMNLSDRVWNYTSQFKAEMEQVLDVGIRNGMSASEMSQDLKQYLNNPDNFFRRFRYKEGVDDAGKPIYGKQWKRRYFDEDTQSYKWENVDLNDYRPGRGVYRSSYKNAMRLAGTETNMAYRSADHERWQQMDFVVGIKIEVSNTNHPIPDICDELAGDYPKDFKWTGWHPHCRCHALSILKTDEELASDVQRILNGEEPSEDSVNTVTDVPQGFKDWCNDNETRVQKAPTVPYFITENSKYLPKELSEIIETPHKQGGIIELDTWHTQRVHKDLGTRVLASMDKTQQDNAKEVADILGANISKPMTFDMADNGNVNPKYGQSAKFERNCSLSVVTAEARIRGIDVQALGVNEPKKGKTSIAYELGLDFTKAWVKPNGEKPKLLTLDIKENFGNAISSIQTLTKENGRYYLGFDGEIINHAINIYRHNGRLYVFDQQVNGSYDLFGFLKKMKAKKIEILRIDNLLFDKTFVSHWMTG